jgi:chromosome partitioning protein
MGDYHHLIFELRGRVERRAGYTIDQISHMRSIFGNPNQRPADKNPAVLAVMSHKGGVYKTLILQCMKLNG